jgi:hypothetical protein
MKKVDASLFIDANQYLKLYMADTGKKKLLHILSENQTYIFVTSQVVDEVQRNKLSVAERFLKTITQEVKERKLPTFDTPEHFFGRSDSTAEGLHEKLAHIQRETQEVEEILRNAAFQVLQQISRSEDEVSKALAELFSKAVIHTEEELQHAKERRDRGNPPGKPAGPLGDQLNWEQLLSHCKHKSKIWLVSEDSDYTIKFQGKRFLNSFLQGDLERVNQPPPDVFCFDNILKAIEDFESKTGVKHSTPLTEDESHEIKDELDSLPPFGFDGPEYGVQGFDRGYWTGAAIRAMSLPHDNFSTILDSLPENQLRKMIGEMPQEKLNAFLETLPGYKLKKMFDELPEQQLKRLLDSIRH